MTRYRLLNTGKANIQFGNSPDEIFRPNDMIIVDEEIGKRLIRLHGHNITDLDNIKVAHDGTGGRDFTKSAAKTAAKPLSKKELEAQRRAEEEAELAALEEATKPDGEDEE